MPNDLDLQALHAGALDCRALSLEQWERIRFQAIRRGHEERAKLADAVVAAVWRSLRRAPAALLSALRVDPLSQGARR
jgi:hypothetical protein